MKLSLNLPNLAPIVRKNIYAIIAIAIFTFAYIVDSLTEYCYLENNNQDSYTSIITWFVTYAHYACLILLIIIAEFKSSKITHILSSAVLAAFCLFLCFGRNIDLSYTYYWVSYLILTILLICSIPRKENLSFYTNAYNKIKNITISYVIGYIVMGILSLLFLFITFILDINTLRLISYVTFPLCIFALAPFLFLVLNERSANQSIEENYLLSVVKYVFLPAVAIASIAPYIFVIKIIILGALPEGEIAYTLTIFMVFAFIAQGLATLVKDSRLAPYFKYIHFTLIVPFVLIIISLNNRVGHYGLTESRIMLYLLLTFMALLIIQSIIAKSSNRYLMCWIAITLLALSTYFPYISAKDIANRSQLNILTENLNKINVSTTDSIDWADIFDSNDSITIASIRSAEKYLDDSILIQNSLIFKDNYYSAKEKKLSPDSNIIK